MTDHSTIPDSLQADTWTLANAKARLSEVVDRAPPRGQPCGGDAVAVQSRAQRGRDPVVVLHEQDVHLRPPVRNLLPERNPMGSSSGWTGLSDSP